MKHLKRSLALLLSAAMMLAVMAGCGAFRLLGSRSGGIQKRVRTCCHRGGRTPAASGICRRRNLQRS